MHVGVDRRGWMGGWIGGWMGRWVDGRHDGQTESAIYLFKQIDIVTEVRRHRLRFSEYETRIRG